MMFVSLSPLKTQTEGLHSELLDANETIKQLKVKLKQHQQEYITSQKNMECSVADISRKYHETQKQNREKQHQLDQLKKQVQLRIDYSDVDEKWKKKLQLEEQHTVDCKKQLMHSTEVYTVVKYPQKFKYML